MSNNRQTFLALEAAHMAAIKAAGTIQIALWLIRKPEISRKRALNLLEALGSAVFKNSDKVKDLYWHFAAAAYAPFPRTFGLWAQSSAHSGLMLCAHWLLWLLWSQCRANEEIDASKFSEVAEHLAKHWKLVRRKLKDKYRVTWEEVDHWNWRSVCEQEFARAAAMFAGCLPGSRIDQRRPVVLEDGPVEIGSFVFNGIAHKCAPQVWFLLESMQRRGDRAEVEDVIGDIWDRAVSDNSLKQIVHKTNAFLKTIGADIHLRQRNGFVEKTIN
jgi:hypothetical protein